MATGQPTSLADQHNLAEFLHLIHPSTSSANIHILPIAHTMLRIEVNSDAVLSNCYANVLKGYTTTNQTKSSVEPISIKKI
ncbi:hypothetical protein H5410_040310 [Solanum commersonii]|uniref:Uncharacterized protein n=1 Tax=Solanum commersonii TaxID=4109 RepID=A0A9J5XR09_SOLCO|nr:hypothetical protein H5410_040310 [Solanum commersonii]